MKIAIHQPNFCPYIGFFEKVKSSDIFILLDHVQYSKGDWHNRNRIMSQQGPQYLTIPVNATLEKRICDVNIAPEYNVTKIMKTLDQCYNKTKYYEFYRPEFFKIFNSAGIALKTDSGYELERLNYNLLSYICNILNIPTSKFILSNHRPNLNYNLANNELLVDLMKNLWLEEPITYISGEGAKSYLDVKLFEEHNINVIFQHFIPTSYKQLYTKEFIPNLSMQLP